MGMNFVNFRYNEKDPGYLPVFLPSNPIEMDT